MHKSYEHSVGETVGFFATLFLLIAAIIATAYFGYIQPKFFSKTSTVITKPDTQVRNDSGPGYIEPITGTDVTLLYATRFRVNGKLTSVSDAKSGVSTYTDIEGNMHTLYAAHYPFETSVVQRAIDDYAIGDYAAIQDYLEFKNKDNLEYLYYTLEGKFCPLIYDGESDTYATVIPYTDGYVYAYCDDEFYITEDVPTRIFGSATEDQLTTHTYSELERNASDNTIAALLEEGYGVQEDVTEKVEPNYVTSSLTYTEDADNATRDQMALYGNYKWNNDGTSPDTSVVLDITSPSVKASEWVLKESSVYSWSDNSLRLTQLFGSRTDSDFKIAGTVTNQLKSPRPWVLVLEFLNQDGELIGVRTVDCRTKPLDAEGEDTFKLVVESGHEIPISDIYSVQFIIF